MINDVYKTLSAVNFKGKTEKKNGLTYVSWATAWGKLKECYRRPLALSMRTREALTTLQTDLPAM